MFRRHLFSVILSDTINLQRFFTRQISVNINNFSFLQTMSLFSHLLPLLLAVLVSGKGRPGNCGNYWCTCDFKQKLATCKDHGRNLTYIPNLPKYVTKLEFSGNHIPHVSARTFDNIISLHLSQMNITYSSIKHLTPDAFSSLIHLKLLGLNGNKISSRILAGTFPSLAKLPITTFSLQNMSWRSTSMFRQFHSQSLKSLILSRNKLNVYNHSDFEHIFNLGILELGHNYITSVILAHSPSLQKLDLRDNIVSTFPNFCPGEGVYFPQLKELKLDNNKISSIDSQRIKCLKQLLVFSMNNNRILRLLTNTFSELPSLTYLILRSIGGVVTIDKYAFNNSNVQYISITNGGVRFKTNVHKDAFRGCSNIKSVDVSHNVFYQCSDDDLDAWFGHLTSLEGIGLGECGLQRYPTFIQRLKRLKYLKLYKNYIREIPAGVLQPMTNLTHLWLTSNRFAKIAKTAFPQDVRERLEVISLMYNPFACNCDLLWFLRWTKSEPDKFQFYPQKYACNSPRDVKGKVLSEVNLTEYTCILPLRISSIIIGCVCSFLLILLTSTLTYRCRWHIRYFLYQRKKKRGDFRRAAPVDILYDAYVIYSLEDIKWIKNELITNLEDESDKKLYIRDRDSLAGIPIVDNVVNNMTASRRVLVVLSNAMAKDEQCQFELMFVQRQEEEQMTPIILVLLEEIQAANVTQSVYALVKMNSYISWGEERDARDLFWNHLQHSLQNVEDVNQGPVL